MFATLFFFFCMQSRLEQTIVLKRKSLKSFYFINDLLKKLLSKVSVALMTKPKDKTQYGDIYPASWTIFTSMPAFQRRLKCFYKHSHISHTERATSMRYTLGAGGLMWYEKGQMCFRIEAVAQPARLDDHLKPDGQTETDEQWHWES